MELFKLFGTIALDNSAANEGIDETTGKASKAHSKMVDSFKKIGTAVTTYLAVDKIIDFGSACIQAAADAGAMNSQFTQVFGDLEDQAAANLSNLAQQAGITENRMKGSYTKIASFAKTAGMETADALSLADRAMLAVADSAAFYDRSLEETTESLQSFLKGNYENDAALGLSCTETTRNAAANELYGKSFKDLSESQKQLTLLKMVEDANAASGALGQAARESDTWTNQTGNLKQAWTDFKAVIGANFLEPAVGAIKKVTEVVIELSGKVPEVIEWFKSMYDRASVFFPAIQEFVGKVGDVFAEKMPEIKAFAVQCFEEIEAFWVNHLQPCLEAIGDFVENVLAPVFEFVFTDVVVPTVKTAFEYIMSAWDDVLKPALTGITDFLTGVFTLNFEKVFTGLVSIVKGAANGIISAFEFGVNGAISVLNGLISGVNKIVSTAGSALGLNIKIPTIPKTTLPRLEEGGILEKGQIGLLEGNGAEAVVPLDQNKAWISAVAKDMNAAVGGDDKLQKIIDLLESMSDYFPQLVEAAGHDIVTNDGVIVARYAPMMNAALGKISAKKERGR